MKNVTRSLLRTFINGVALSFVLHALPANAETIMPMPDSWNRIIGILDFAQPDMSEAEILLNAGNYSTVLGGLARLNDIFRVANPDINIARYTTGFFDEYNARPTPYPGGREGDTPERRARTLLWWNTEVDGTGHPDWVLYQCNRTTPAYWTYDDGTTLPNVPLDISNPAVAEWQLRTTDQPGFSAHLTDLVSLENYYRACGIWRGGQWVQLFSGNPIDPAYTAAVIQWAAQIEAGLRNRRSPMGLIPNSVLLPSYRDEDIDAFLDNIDGLLDEEGFTGYGVNREYVAESVWLNKIRNMIRVQGGGIAYYLMNYVETFPPSDEELEWVLSSFLMGKAHSAYILMTLSPALGDYGARWPHLPQYDASVGHPCGDMYSAQNVYARDYSMGLAVANPSRDTTYVYQRPDGYFVDINGQFVDNQIVLPPLSGKVLLTSQRRCP